MNNKTLTLLAAMMLCAATTFAQKTLTILHTNDTHSCITPLKDNLPDTTKAGRGGFLRRIAMLKEERAKDPDLLLFDSGDFSQGSAYYTLFKGDAEAGLMNQMGYAAGTIGNHEFDFGLENMARVFASLNFPIICSNYTFSQYNLQNIVKPYVILHHKGLKIGVFALAPELAGLVDKRNYGDTQYLNPVATAQKMADLLHKQNCDIVICLSHLGWSDMGMGDQEMISHTRGIDLVLGGHSHTDFEKIRYVSNLDGKPIPVDQNGSKGLFVGKVILHLDKK